MKNYSVITASAQTDFDYPAGFVKSVVTSDFSHFITKSPAINRFAFASIENFASTVFQFNFFVKKTPKNEI